MNQPSEESSIWRRLSQGVRSRTALWFGRSQDHRSYLDRVDRFWEWFADRGERICRSLGPESDPREVHEVGAAVKAVIGIKAWLVGPGESDDGLSLTLSPEGDKHLRLLTEVWASRAPRLEGWTFYGSRQAGHGPKGKLQVGGKAFDFENLRFVPKPDLDRANVDVVIHHHGFASSGKMSAWKVAFLALDEALGEDGTSTLIGDIKIGSEPNTLGALSITEFQSQIRTWSQEHGWPLSWHFDVFTLYNRKEDAIDLEAPRGDIVTGSTNHFRLIQELSGKSSGNWKFLLRLGAEYSYLSIRADDFPEGLSRVELESRIANCSERVRVLGGATGVRHQYIDLLILDRTGFMEELHTWWAQSSPVSRAKLISFHSKGSPTVDLMKSSGI